MESEGTAGSDRPGVDSRISKSAQTRRRILDAAAEVFSERGYSATRLSDIADSIGMKAGSLYYHFSSKEELADEVLKLATEQAFSATRASVSALPANASAGERLRVALTSHITACLEASNYMAASVRLIGQVPDDIRRRHHKRDQWPHGEYFYDLFNAAAATGEIRADLDLVLVRFLTMGAVNWVNEWPPSLRVKTNEISDTLIGMVFDGLSPRPDPNVSDRSGVKVEHS